MSLWTNPQNYIERFVILSKNNEDISFSIFEYLILGFLLVNAIMIKPIDKSTWIAIIAFIIIFPIIDETVQHFTPGRIPDLMDGIADISGGLVGIYLRRLFP